MISRLKWIEETIVDATELQVCNLDNVCTKELGEAVDIIKDLEEAIYYHTITEAMKTDKTTPAMEHHEVMHEEEWDERLGRSPRGRKMYMEARAMNKEKAVQLRELEKYMQELAQDITEMIADASLEEKQYLEKKITAMASKIGQMK